MELLFPESPILSIVAKQNRRNWSQTLRKADMDTLLQVLFSRLIMVSNFTLAFSKPLLY